MSAAQLAQSAQKLSILREAQPSEVVAVVDAAGADGTADLVRRAFAAFGVAGLHGNALQLYSFRTPRGTPHFYAQPFDGRTPLPGEHHIVLPIPCPAPAIHADGFAGGSWDSSDAGFRSALRKHAVAQLVLRASWDWKIGIGKVKRDWLAQLRPTADGRTHLVMKATGEGNTAIDTRPVGFATLTQLVLALMQQPPATSAAPGALAFTSPATYLGAFAELQSMPAPPTLPRANLAGRELGGAIHQLLAPHAGGKLHVHPVPANKAAAARGAAMPAEARHLPIVALLDRTMLGSATDALVLTPTHAFCRDGDERLVFEWSEVRGVAPLDAEDQAEVSLRLAERGWVTLRCGEHARPIAALLHELAQIPA